MAHQKHYFYLRQREASWYADRSSFEVSMNLKRRDSNRVRDSTFLFLLGHQSFTEWVGASGPQILL